MKYLKNITEMTDYVQYIHVNIDGDSEDVSTPLLLQHVLVVNLNKLSNVTNLYIY